MRGALAGLGVGTGDRVALLCANGRFFVETYLATLGLGAVAVPLNPTSPGPELQRELSTVGAKVVYPSSDYVFDGSKGDPYVESDGTFPLGAYGRSKTASSVRLIACSTHSVHTFAVTEVRDSRWSISRFRDGWVLLKMTLIGFFRIKMGPG